MIRTGMFKTGKRSIMAMILAIVVTFSFMPVTAFADTEFEPRIVGDTIYVADANELRYVAEQVNAGTASFTRVELQDDIDLNGLLWTPIGMAAKPFSGEFDGEGYTIKNLTLKGKSSTGNGLFGYVTGTAAKHAVIKDVTIDGKVNITTSNEGAALVSTAKYTEITNVTNKADISAPKGTHPDQVGGLVAVGMDGTILKDCTNEGTITTDAPLVGGIIAGMRQQDSSVERCANKGTLNLTHKNNTSFVAGGVTGEITSLYSTKTALKFENCFNAGDIKDLPATQAEGIRDESSHYNVGGVIGNAKVSTKGASFKNLYNVGTIDARYGAGGIFGTAGDSMYIYTCPKYGLESIYGMTVGKTANTVAENLYNAGEIKTSFDAYNKKTSEDSESGSGEGGLVVDEDGTIHLPFIPADGSGSPTEQPTIPKADTTVSVILAGINGPSDLAETKNAYTLEAENMAVGIYRNMFKKSADVQLYDPETVGFRSDEWMKSDEAAAALGDGFVKDYGNINNGYPVLAFQLESDEVKGNFKDGAKASLETYKNKEDYRSEEAAQLDEAIAAGKVAIDEAENAEQIGGAVADAHAAMDAVKTDLALTGEEAASELENYKDAADYRAEEQAALADAVEAGKAEIAKAESKDEVAAALEAAKAAADEIKTDLAYTKEEAVKELDDYAVSKEADEHTTDQLKAIHDAAAEAAKVVKAAESKEAVSEAVENAKAEMDSVPAKADFDKELAAAKDEAVQGLDEAFAGITTEDETAAKAVETILMNAKVAVSKAKDKDSIDAIVAKAVSEANKAVDDAAGKTDAESAELAYGKVSALNELSDYHQKNASKLDAAATAAVLDAITAINSAKDQAEVSSILAKAKEVIDTAVKNAPKPAPAKAKKKLVTKITIKGKKTRRVKAGKTIKLKAAVTAPKGANKKLKWKSSNKKWAKVSKTGKVKTLKAGRGKKVKITAMATDGSGKKATVIIKIKKK